MGRGVEEASNQPHEPGRRGVSRVSLATCKPPASFTVRGENAGRPLVPMPGPARSKALSLARRIEPRRATRLQERELQERRLDSRGDRGAEMVAVAGPRFCAEGPELMSIKPKRAATPVTAGNVPAPVSVRLRRINSDHARPYPPDGQAREWWQRLKNAFGTTSSASGRGRMRSRDPNGLHPYRSHGRA